MFDGSVPWSVGVGGGERSWRALGAPKRLWSDGFLVIDGVFVVAVGVSAEEGGEWPRGGGGVVRMLYYRVSCFHAPYIATKQRRRVGAVSGSCLRAVGTTTVTLNNVQSFARV